MTTLLNAQFRNCFCATGIFRSLLFAAIFQLTASGLHGQVLNPLPCNNPANLPPACEGQPYELSFLSSSGAPFTSANVVPGADWTSLQSNAGMVFTGTGRLHSNGLSIPSGAMGTYNFSVRGNAPAEAETPFVLEVRASGGCSSNPGQVPCLQELALVIDKSGSMGWGVDPSLPLSATNLSKWRTVGNILNAHFPTMRTSADPDLNIDDRWAAILFQGSSATLTTGGTFSTNPNISSLFTGSDPDGGTPLGTGIQEALQAFFHNPAPSPIPGNGRRRAVIVVTDGDQNGNPMVMGASGSVQLADDGIHGTPAVPNSGAVMPLPINLHTSNDSDIRYYCLSIGALSSAAQAMLEALSRGAGNSMHTLTATDTEIRDFLNQTIVNYLEENSPRVLDTQFGATTSINSTIVHKYVVNDSVQNLTFRYLPIESGPDSAVLTVYHNGLLVNPEITMPAQTNLRLLQIKFPYQAPNGQMTGSTGNWELRVRNSTVARYEATAFVNDERFRPRLEIGPSPAPMYAGDDIPVKVKIEFKGQPVAGATVVATMYRPGDDLPDLASRASTPKDLMKREAGSTLSQAKLDYTVTDSATLARLALQEKSITLQDDGNGEYSGVFHGNEVTGSYTVVVRLEGSRSDIGPYQGWIKKSRFLDFSRPEDIRLQEKLVYNGSRWFKGSNGYVLRITPLNKFGRRIGPGEMSRIFVSTSVGTVGSIKDELNGSYTIPLNINSGSNALVTVNIIDRDKPVKQKRLFNFASANPFGISLHSGVTLPFQNLDPTYNGGLYTELDLTYKFNLRWSLQAIGGYYGFKPAHQIAGGALFGAYTIPALFGSGLDLQFAGGLGAYQPKNEAVTFGYGLKAGVGAYINAHLNVQANFSYFGLPKPNYSFGATGLGIIYFF